MLISSRIALLLGGGIPLACAVLYPLVADRSAMIGGSSTAPVASYSYSADSKLVSRHPRDPQYFWGRPAAGSAAFHGMTPDDSAGPDRQPHLYPDTVKGRLVALLAADPGNRAPIPADLITASGPGMDSEISVEAARYQVRRIAKNRGISAQQIEDLIARHVDNASAGRHDSARIDVMVLNQALDERVRRQ